MKLDLRESKGVTILDISGQVTAGGGDQMLQEAIDTLVASGRTRIVVNLSGVDFMDSAGIGELVASHRMVERFGGKLKITRPHSRVENSLSTAKLLPLFEVFDDEAAAVESFEQS
ncbi:MAG TPA: STAS domain-containing protein [Vicinamibacteria bacterium]|jgi:anti-sigma B factor antagonist